MSKFNDLAFIKSIAKEIDKKNKRKKRNKKIYGDTKMYKGLEYRGELTDRMKRARDMLEQKEKWDKIPGF